ncbi:MAG: nucleotidyltransferase domain-containing protein [Endomicrobiia bacterium]|nr:nucleotidyltransferase domain-containing protein [Endomicrobiia bacterium]
MQFSKAAERILASPANIGVLRLFVTTRPQMTGREVARFCKMSHTHALRTLDALTEQGLITRGRAGRAYLFQLNDKNTAVNTLFKPFFDKEKTLLTDVVAHALKGIKSKILSAVIFGSAARGAERPQSDVDLFILVRSKKEVSVIEKHLSAAEVDFYECTGSRLAPIVMSPCEMKKKMKTNRALFENISAGKIVVGRRPQETL